ncbi:MAG: hypothetical protein J6M43_04230 [Neisseriaceae bacterium]|nr:hypothetical protein [Neisseriaceae bacterium]
MKHPAILLTLTQLRQAYANLLAIAQHYQGCKIFVSCYQDNDIKEDFAETLAGLLYEEDDDISIDDDTSIEYNILTQTEIKHLRSVGLVNGAENRKTPDGQNVAILPIDCLDEKAYATLYFVANLLHYNDLSYIIAPKDTANDKVFAFIDRDNQLKEIIHQQPNKNIAAYVENMSHLADSLEFVWINDVGGYECAGSPAALFACLDKKMFFNIRTLPCNTKHVLYDDKIFRYTQDYGCGICSCFDTEPRTGIYIDENLYRKAWKKFNSWQPESKTEKQASHSFEKFLKYALRRGLDNI